MERIYLDYAATTPVSSAVFEAMKPFFGEKFGNAGSLHAFGQTASKALDESRESLAKILGVSFREIIFTGSATEANNLALRGAVRRFKETQGTRPRIIVSAIEHESVIETLKDLERTQVEAVFLPVNHEGFVDPKALANALDRRTVMISVSYANNEIGVIQPIKELADLTKDFRGRNPYPLIHTDAVQAFQFLDCRPAELGVDLMTLSAHKIYGPKGIGLLYLGESTKPLIDPIVFGGGQEFGLRSGTENIPNIVGFAKAAEIIDRDRIDFGKRISGLRDSLWRGLKENVSAVELNGPDVSSAGRLANNLNVFFEGRSAETLIVRLDQAGLAVSLGSACRSRSAEPSYVIEALNLGQNRAGSSLRITLGRPTTDREIKKAVEVISACTRK